MKFTVVNNVVINMEYIDYVEETNNGQSITVHMNSGTQFLFDITDAQNLLHCLHGNISVVADIFKDLK